MLPFIRLDIEPTNRCNADCYFCPRDMTPDEGLMTPEIFDAALARAVEFRPLAREELELGFDITLCGLGEPLLNKHVPEWVGRIRQEGFAVSLSSNGGLLSEKKGAALLDAGLQQIDINVGEIEEEYENIYKLPWERTLQNILAFHEAAGDKCIMNIVLVNHRRDKDHMSDMVEFWKGHGIDTFLAFEIMNRGGSLFVDHLSFEQDASAAKARKMLEDANGSVPPCAAPFLFPFIGYDGQYYLCCSDWTKKTAMGSVIDTPLVDVTLAKLDHAIDRQVVCKTCNLDPLNLVAENLKADEAGETTRESTEELVDRLTHGAEVITSMVDTLRPHMRADASSRRRRIPLEAR